MTKLRKNISFKKIKKSTLKALPVVNKGLEKIGKTSKDVIVKSKPYLEKGVSVVYDTLSTGFDLGIKGAKSIAYKMKKSRKNKSRKSHRRSRRHSYTR
jgi:hypothetical protein